MKHDVTMMVKKSAEMDKTDASQKHQTSKGDHKNCPMKYLVASLASSKKNTHKENNVQQK